MKESLSEIYDAIAPFYRDYSKKKSSYINAVDCFILSHMPVNCNALLDVGAGDGIRGMQIAREKNIQYAVLCDPSSEMIKKCRELNPNELWHCAAEDLPDSNKTFDIILCLWNVFGHLESKEKRIRALNNMSRLLSDGGMIFLDVNNRYNATSYGKINVIKRVIIDFLHPDEKRGDSCYEWIIGERSFPGMGHLFTPLEMKSIINKCNLNIVYRVSINYETGKISRNPFLGQLVYILKKSLR